MNRFDELDLYFRVLRNEAKYLMTTDYQHYTVILYAWQQYFIEQYYDNELELTTQITLASDAHMEKFLKDISIRELGFPVEE